MSIRIAIIGAGASGLCALRHALGKLPQFSPIVFERSDRVGGTWVYTDKKGNDEYGHPIHSSMYKNLRTNIPKEVMKFPDFPFKEDLPSFVGHSDVLGYLEQYATHFCLYDHIKFRTSVDKVEPVTRSGGKLPKWKVTCSKVTHPSETTTEEFDGVIICVGHYSVPLMPDIKGLESFKGRVVHSHYYRTPHEFTEKRVVVLGAGASGLDISVDLSPVAEKIYLCHNKDRLETSMPDNTEQATGISEVLERSVKLLDNQEVDCDVILLCTGYHFSFPFLGPECQLQIKDERITPLFHHVVHTLYPSLFFMGICKTICPFPQFHLQAQFCLKVLNGMLKLPSTDEMNEHSERDYNERLEDGLAPRYAHVMGPRQWEYNKTICELAKLENIPKNVQLLYDHVHSIRRKQLTTYKQLNFKLSGPESFETICS